jgi:hypothetical protein
MHVFVLRSPIESSEWFFVARWGIVMWSNYVIIVEIICTTESMNPRPCFQALQYRFRSLLLLATLLFLFIQIIKIYFYHPYYTCITIFMPNWYTYTIYHCIGCVGDTRDSLLFGCRVVWERPSSSYASHGLINLRSSTWGKIATVLQNAALGGPTRVYKNKLCSRHQDSCW